MSIPASNPSATSSARPRAPRFLRRLLGSPGAQDDIVIRKLRAEDLPRFFNPGELTLGEKWLGQQERDEMYVAAAEIDGVAVGRTCLLYNFKSDPPSAYSFATSVSAEWRSRGIGSALIAHIERVAHSRGLYHLSSHSVTTNPRAAVWKERMGYRRVREETIHWEETDGRHVESLSWKFERAFTPPAWYRIRRWVRSNVSELRQRLVMFRRKPN